MVLTRLCSIYSANLFTASRQFATFFQHASLTLQRDGTYVRCLPCRGARGHRLGGVATPVLWPRQTHTYDSRTEKCVFPADPRCMQWDTNKLVIYNMSQLRLHALVGLARVTSTGQTMNERKPAFPSGILETYSKHHANILFLREVASSG